MEGTLRDILRKNKYFNEIDENKFIPEYLGLIVNGLVLYHVSWINILKKELVFMQKDIQTQPTASVDLENLNSLMIITNEGIEKVL